MAAPATDRQRLREARKVARAQGWGAQAVCSTNHAVIITYGRPVEERDAATEFVRSREAMADEWTEDGPVWLGHALHEAFLAGVDWARRQE